MTENHDAKTTIEFDLGPGIFGVDMRLRVAHTFDKEATDPHYGEEAAKALASLFTVAYGKVNEISTLSQRHVGAIPKGYVSVIDLATTPSQQVAPTVRTPVTQPTAAGITAVANGAPVATTGAGGWQSYPGKSFGNDAPKPYRALTPEAYPTTQLEEWCHKTLIEMGLDPNKFKVYDERPLGAQGRPISAAANVKVKPEFESDPILAGRYKTVFRVHFSYSTNTPEAKVDPHWATLLKIGNLGTFALAAGVPAQPVAPAQPVQSVQALPAPATPVPAPVTGGFGDPWETTGNPFDYLEGSL